MNYYIKYQLKYSLILEILQKLKKKKVNFFIDLQSITKGFYNKEVILVEIGRFATEGKVSDILIQELRNFLNNIYVQFKSYDPFFILAYDDGYCAQQNLLILLIKVEDQHWNLLSIMIKNYNYLDRLKILFEKIERMFIEGSFKSILFKRI